MAYIQDWGMRVQAQPQINTDTTLTIAGKAADAKEVGDQLTSVKEDLQDLVARVTALEE